LLSACGKGGDCCQRQKAHGGCLQLKRHYPARRAGENLLKDQGRHLFDLDQFSRVAACGAM